MKISHGLEFALVWSLTKLVQFLPDRAADALAVGLGKLAYLILASRRRIADENLRRASGLEFPPDEREKIIRRVFVNIARMTVEFARQPTFTPEKILAMVPVVEGLEYIEKVLAEGKGSVLISGHVSNWELYAGWAKAKGYPIDLLVGRQHNHLVDELLISFRRSQGLGIIPIGVAARHVIKALRSGRFVAIVADQHAASGGIVVDFFGRKASTPAGPAAFAVKVDCPILAGALVREGYNRHRAIILPPIYPPRTGDAEKDILTMTQAYTSAIEMLIRRYPDQWMWTHRRWKIE